MDEIKGKSALILGYGREGQSVHRYLMDTHPRLKIGIADISHVEPIDKNVTLHLGKDYLTHIGMYDTIVRSPGIPANLSQLKSFSRLGKPVTSATNIFFSVCPGVVIGITGTKGKSTTASLIADVLATKFGDVRLVGNIGKPALDHIVDTNKKTIFVCELSSQQLEDLKFSPHIAVIHAIYPEHLDSHGTFSQYLSAKSNIVKYQEAGDFVIYNSANKSSAKLAQLSAGKKIPFSASKNRLSLKSSEIPLIGPGNVDNVLAVICAASIFDIPPADIKSAIKKFKSLPHRLEYVGNVRGVKFYNDSQATNPAAVINALEGFRSQVGTLIVGGYDRGLDLRDLAKYIAGQDIVNLILLPTTGKKIWPVIFKTKDKNQSMRKFEANSMEVAVDLAFKHTPKGKICLLSPGAASFGLFKNYEERGNLFKSLVLSRRKSHTKI